MSNGSTRTFAELERAVDEISAGITLPEPAFEFSIGWAPSYDALFAHDLDRSSGIAELIDVALRRGRVLLHAEGGTGKSVILQRLFRVAEERGLIPVLVDVRRWRPPLFDEWEDAEGNELLRTAILLGELGAPSTEEATLSQLPPERHAIVLLDGVNEVPSATADSILATLESFAWRNPAAGVIATDRLVRRNLPSDAWRLATIKPLARESIAQLLQRPIPEGSARLLSSAFFLDLALSQGLDSTSSSRAFRSYFEQHVELTQDELAAATEGAYQMYATQRARTFPLDTFARIAGDRPTNALREAGTLLIEGTTAYFRHHLYHDYLAAAHLAADAARWGYDAFDALTFNASSFDALAMALEQLEEPPRADELLRRIYDWNFYGSAYALAKGRQLGSIQVSEQMEVALLALLAERRWDLIRPTSDRVTDALRIFPGQRARAFLEVASHTELIALVDDIEIDGPEFERWRELFSTPVATRAEEETLTLLESEDSLLGWTAANVLKRLRLEAAEEASLRRMLAEGTATVRWRASHVLGAHPSQPNIEALFGALADEYHWVRYGCIRSLVEIAARAPDLREPIFVRLREIIRDLAQDEATIREFERALILREPPPGWTESVEPVIDELWANAETIELQDHWRRVAYDVRRAELTERAAG